jgi:hypothetical protein
MNLIRNRFAISPRRATAACLAALLALALAAPGAAQERTVHRNLAELVKQSEVVLFGEVMDARVEPHPDFPKSTTVLITLRVREVLKGKAADEFTFRQYVFDPREAQARLGYKKGEAVVLMLHGNSRLGLTSPVAMDQGRFRVFTDSGGNMMVVNGLQNAGLFRNVRTTMPALESQVGAPARQLLQQHSSGPIPYDQFREIVRNLAAQ